MPRKQTRCKSGGCDSMDPMVRKIRLARRLVASVRRQTGVSVGAVGLAKRVGLVKTGRHVARSSSGAARAARVRVSDEETQAFVKAYSEYAQHTALSVLSPTRVTSWFTGTAPANPVPEVKDGSKLVHFRQVVEGLYDDSGPAGKQVIEQMIEDIDTELQKRSVKATTELKTKAAEAATAATSGDTSKAEAAKAAALQAARVAASATGAVARAAVTGSKFLYGVLNASSTAKAAADKTTEAATKAAKQAEEAEQALMMDSDAAGIAASVATAAKLADQAAVDAEQAAAEAKAAKEASKAAKKAARAQAATQANTAPKESSVRKRYEDLAPSTKGFNYFPKNLNTFIPSGDLEFISTNAFLAMLPDGLGEHPFVITSPNTNKSVWNALGVTQADRNSSKPFLVLKLQPTDRTWITMIHISPLGNDPDYDGSIRTALQFARSAQWMDECTGTTHVKPGHGKSYGPSDNDAECICRNGYIATGTEPFQLDKVATGNYDTLTWVNDEAAA